MHPCDPKIDMTFHRLRINNRSGSVVVHDSVVLDGSGVHTEFIADSILDFVFETIFIVSNSKKIVFI